MARSTSAGTCDVFAALLLVAFVLLAAGTHPASARSYSKAPANTMKAKVRNYVEDMPFVMNGVSVPPRSTRTVVVLRIKLEISVSVIFSGKKRSVITVTVSLKYLLSDQFVLELRRCTDCRGCRRGKSKSLCLRGSIFSSTKFQKCPINIILPGGGSSPPPPPPPVVLPPVATPPVATPPVATPPVTLPPVLPPVTLPPIVNALGPILAPIVDPLIPIVAPIVAPVGPILAPIVDPLVPIVAPIVDPLAPIVATITAPLGPILAPVVDPLISIVAPIVAPLAPLLSPITTPILAPLLPPSTLPPLLP